MVLFDFWLLALLLDLPEARPLVLAEVLTLVVGGARDGVDQARLSQVSNGSKGAGSDPEDRAKFKTSGVRLISAGEKLTAGCDSATAICWASDKALFLLSNCASSKACLNDAGVVKEGTMGFPV